MINVALKHCHTPCSAAKCCWIHITSGLVFCRFLEAPPAAVLATLSSRAARDFWSSWGRDRLWGASQGFQGPEDLWYKIYINGLYIWIRTITTITNPKFKQPQWYFSPQGFVFCLPEKNGMILGNSWLLGWCATALDPRFMGSQTSFCCWSACTSASTAWQSCFMAAFSKTFFGILKWRFPGFLSHGCSPKSSTWWSFGAHSCCDDQRNHVTWPWHL